MSLLKVFTLFAVACMILIVCSCLHIVVNPHSEDSSFLSEILEKSKKHQKKKSSYKSDNFVYLFNHTRGTYENIPFWKNDNIFKNINCSSGEHMTSAIYTRLTLISVSKKTGIIEIRIRAFTGYNHPKRIGGDIFLLWAEQVHGDGRVAGQVIDRSDGTYNGFITMHWTGKTIIKCELGSTIENFCVRRKAFEK